MKKILVSLLIFFVLLILPSKAFASDNFSTSYNVNYQVLDSGTTHVTFNISLTNKTSQFYASSYKIQVGFTHLNNVRASDPNGQIVPTVFQVPSGNSIEVNFNDKVVGKDNTLTFNLSFDTDDIVQRQGSIWEVNIPGISNQNDFSDFKAHVSVPSYLGSPTYIKPEQPTKNLDFTRDQLGTSGISIAFGDRQTYGFSLAYHLENTNLFPIKTEIALPPTTNYQDMEIDSIDPKPLNVTVDQDGNWLAQYTLLPSTKKEIVVKGKAQLLLYPRKKFETSQNLQKYLTQQNYWEISNPKIKDIAKNLKTPREVYQFVVDHLTYDFGRVSQNKPRLGALGVLQDPTSAVCLEFTDLFVALARSAGIPAREIDGFAYTQNTSSRPLSKVLDILHSWPEYYDSNQQTWVMVDPTWGNTTGGIDYFDTLDFDHFAFVIKGLDSSYPVPAGGYKTDSTQNQKDVNVSFADAFSAQAPTIELKPNLPITSIAGLPISGSITIRNVSNLVYPQQFVDISTSVLSPTSKKIDVSQIPPFGFVTVPLSYQSPNFLTNKTALVTIRLADREFPNSIKVVPFFLTAQGIIGGILLALLIASISIFAARARHLPFSRREGGSALRGEGEKP